VGVLELLGVAKANVLLAITLLTGSTGAVTVGGIVTGLVDVNEGAMAGLVEDVAAGRAGSSRLEGATRDAVCAADAVENSCECGV
jgi:hypothetical protein